MSENPEAAPRRTEETPESEEAAQKALPWRVGHTIILVGAVLLSLIAGLQAGLLLHSGEERSESWNHHQEIRDQRVERMPMWDND